MGQSGAGKPRNNLSEQDTASGTTDIELPMPPVLGTVSKLSLHLCNVATRVMAPERSFGLAKPRSQGR